MVEKFTGLAGLQSLGIQEASLQRPGRVGEPQWCGSAVGMGHPVQAGGLEHRSLCPEGCTVRRTTGNKPGGGQTLSELRDQGAGLGRRPLAPSAERA